MHVTDVTNASRTMLMDLDTLAWDADIAAEMGIPLSMLPEIRSSSEVYGHGGPGGMLQGVPIAGILGDQQAATFGQVCYEVGTAKNTYGTGNFMLLNTGEETVPSKNGLLTTVCYKIGKDRPVYALEGSIAITGSLVQWLRDNLGIISSAREIETLATTASRTTAARTSCRRSPGSSPRTGGPTRAARSSASPATSTRGTSPAPRSRRPRSRPARCSTR